MYFINRSKLEEPCPFIVACYNLGDRKDHDLELAMHTASKQAQCAQAAHSLLDMDPCYAAAATAVAARGLTCLRTQSIFFFALAFFAYPPPFVLAIYVMRVHTVLFYRAS